MTRLTAKVGPMRLVQCDGFALYAGAGPQKSPEPARRRLAPAARSSPRAVKRRATGATTNRATVLHRPAAWSLGLHSMIIAAVLTGLFSAYTLGRSAAVSGPRNGLVYARPVAATPPAKASSADTVNEPRSPNPYLR